jgi:hypothetical protein
MFARIPRKLVEVLIGRRIRLDIAKDRRLDSWRNAHAADQQWSVSY